MTEYTVVPATAAHAEELAPNARARDVAGILAAKGASPVESILDELALTREPMAGLADGKVMVLFGVQSHTALARDGLVWMLAHHDLPKHSRAFLRASRKYIGHIRQEYDTVRVVVDGRNSTSLRWLKWLGFVFSAPVFLGSNNIPFYPGRLA